MPPLIGITTYERNEKDDFVLPAAYADAVRRAGGIPVLVPPGEPRLDALLARLDGLILSGGMDVDPARYGGLPHARIEPPNPERDETEIALVRGVVADGLPLLGICRGAQLLNVALGGSLVEHLPDEVGEAVAHQTEAGDPTPHPVEIAPGSRLAAIVGARAEAPASWHHQAVRRVAPGLTPVAQAPDGTVEAVEMAGHPWLIGVQWHPELTAATDPAQQRLFDALVAAARARRGG